MSDMKKNALNVDLRQGVVPISKAASSLAALIKRSRSNHQPIIVTQKGYPTGVILDVELFTALRQLAERYDLPEVDAVPVDVDDDE
jgi:prevent-host-death family protein